MCCVTTAKKPSGSNTLRQAQCNASKFLITPALSESLPCSGNALHPDFPTRRRIDSSAHEPTQGCRFRHCQRWLPPDMATEPTGDCRCGELRKKICGIDNGRVKYLRRSETAYAGGMALPHLRVQGTWGSEERRAPRDQVGGYF